MNRRNFFKTIVGAAAAAAVTTGLFVVEKPIRKLKACWTIDTDDDLRAIHNLKAEKELIEILSKEITKEIDQEILRELSV